MRGLRPTESIQSIRHVQFYEFKRIYSIKKDWPDLRWTKERYWEAQRRREADPGRVGSHINRPRSLFKLEETIICRRVRSGHPLVVSRSYPHGQVQLSDSHVHPAPHNKTVKIRAAHPQQVKRAEVGSPNYVVVVHTDRSGESLEIKLEGDWTNAVTASLSSHEHQQGHMTISNLNFEKHPCVKLVSCRVGSSWHAFIPYFNLYLGYWENSFCKTA